MLLYKQTYYSNYLTFTLLHFERCWVQTVCYSPIQVHCSELTNTQKKEASGMEYFFPQGLISQLTSIPMPPKDKLRLGNEAGNTIRLKANKDYFKTHFHNIIIHLSAPSTHTEKRLHFQNKLEK